MNHHTTDSDACPKIAPVYLVCNGETMIDTPIEHVWRYAIDYTSWQNFPVVEHVSGERGQEGEVVLLSKEEKGFKSFPPYYARTIKLDPGRRIIWKTYPQQRTEDNDFFGFVEFRLEEAQGKTRFCNNLLYEFLVPYRDESELDLWRKRQYENFENLLAVVLPKLKKLAEKG